MRLWSIHPKYLDPRGLVALWREALLAKKVLQNRTSGYKNHPQLERFKRTISPISYINNYLQEVYNESRMRNYNFDSGKIGDLSELKDIPVSDGQIKYEFSHLLKKLKLRDEQRYEHYKDIKSIEIFPGFIKTPGATEKWENIR